VASASDVDLDFAYEIFAEAAGMTDGTKQGTGKNAGRRTRS